MPDPKRMQDAVEKAYDAAVEKLFAVLVENLVEANSNHPAPGSVTAPQAALMFSKGMKIAWDAYERASAMVKNVVT
jgi:hypothetical protein